MARHSHSKIANQFHFYMFFPIGFFFITHEFYSCFSFYFLSVLIKLSFIYFLL